MFCRFNVVEEGDEGEPDMMTGVGVIMPNGTAFIEWFRPESVQTGAASNEVRMYGGGISQVIELLEKSNGVDLEWVDEPVEDGGEQNE